MPETPARKRQRLQFNDDVDVIDDNEIEVLEPDEQTNRKLPPSLAARSVVAAAVASHPNPIKELSLAAAQTFNALKAQQRQQTQTRARLSQATFTPRSARLNFTLTGSDSVMESDTFKTLTETVQKATETWSTTVKNAICQVADLEMVKTKTEITSNFLTTLKRIAHLLLLQDDPTTTIDSKFLAAFLLETNGTPLCKHVEISKNAALASLFDPVPYDDDTISEQLQDQLGGFISDFLEIATAIFVTSWNTQLNAYKRQAGDRAAAKQAKEYLDGSATVQAAALMDAEPSVDPALLKDIIKKQVDTETRQLRAELNKLKQIQLRSAKTAPTAKNQHRGAKTTTANRAPSPKKSGRSPRKPKTTQTNRKKTARRFGHAACKRFAARKAKIQNQTLRDTARREIQEAAAQEKLELAKVAQHYKRYFGFFSSHCRTPKHNASLHFAYLPAWFYYQRPTNLSSHNLCTVTQPPLNFRSLLGLGLNFIPRPPLSNRKALSATLARLRKDLYNRLLYAGGEQEYDPKLYARSDRKSPEHLVPMELRKRIDSFSTAMWRLFRKKRSPSNLLPHQRACLHELRTRPDLTVCKTDKNLGPAIMERKRYIELAFRDHLSDVTTYRQLTPAEATQLMIDAEDSFRQWLSHNKDKISKAAQTFLKRTCLLRDPSGNIMFPQFYTLAKLHKIPLRTRPIVSVIGSLLHGLGRWVDRQLQPIARSIPSFVNSSFAFTTKLREQQATAPFPPTALLFTCDAVSMYTNIDTQHGLSEMTCHAPGHVVRALQIIMENNVFQFSDTFWHQLAGTAMGTPPPVCTPHSTWPNTKNTSTNATASTYSTGLATLMTASESGIGQVPGNANMPFANSNVTSNSVN